MSSVDDLKRLKGVMQAGFNFTKGDKIGNINDATERAGYFIVNSKSKKELKENINRVYDHLKIYDRAGKNLVIRELGEVL